jgi:hypothetical protein
VVLLVISASTNYAQGKFGIGVILGEPTGLSTMLYTGSATGFDFAAAWSFKGDCNLLLQADYVWHSSPASELALYYGIGGRVIFQNNPRVGARIPVGLDFQFSSAPVDIFIKLAPVLDLSSPQIFILVGESEFISGFN